MATYTDIKDLIDANLASGAKIPATKHREVEMALLDYIEANSFQTGDIKRVKCDLAYLNDNFDANGLGKNLRLGWAICNGNNGTDNLAGRVGVGYGFGYSALGGIEGSVSENVSIPVSGYGVGANTGGGTSGLLIVSSGQNESGEFFESIKKVSTTTSPVSVNKMQPYIINLYIMKL